jgi:hypothetical protein
MLSLVITWWIYLIRKVHQPFEILVPLTSIRLRLNHVANLKHILVGQLFVKGPTPQKKRKTEHVFSFSRFKITYWFIEGMNLVWLQISNRCWKAGQQLRYKWFIFTNLIIKKEDVSKIHRSCYTLVQYTWFMINHHEETHCAVSIWLDKKLPEWSQTSFCTFGQFWGKYRMPYPVYSTIKY